MNNSEFAEIAEKIIADIAEAIEQQDDNCLIDVDFQSDILSLNTKQGIYIINKQSAVKEIWLSSPLSGPYHFFYEQKVWINKAGLKLIDILSYELKIKF